MYQSVPRTNPDPRALVEAALAGDVRAKARLFTLVENGGSEAQLVLASLAPRIGHAQVVGITGPPGAGKSTLVSRLAGALRLRGETVAVLAVDPSSPITGGAVLGDRIRMQNLHGDPGAYVRSLSTRGAVGGLARAVEDLVTVADALGFDHVLVETVGAGQDEADIAAIAPTVVLVEVPHLGDDVQAIKAGILEIADIFVVNKADREGADQAAAVLRTMLSLVHHPEAWKPPVLKISAINGEGISPLLDAVAAHQKYRQTNGSLEAWRVERARRRLLDGVRERLFERLLATVSRDELDALAVAVAEHRIAFGQAVENLLAVGRESVSL